MGAETNDVDASIDPFADHGADLRCPDVETDNHVSVLLCHPFHPLSIESFPVLSSSSAFSFVCPLLLNDNFSWDT